MKYIIIFFLSIIVLSCSHKNKYKGEFDNDYYFSKWDSLLAKNESGNRYEPSSKSIKLDKSPKPIGGMQEIANKLYYTERAQNVGVEGSVRIQFTVNKLGEVSNIKVVRRLGYGLDNIAIKALKSTKFFPGELNGEKIDTETILPIKFKLE